MSTSAVNKKNNSTKWSDESREFKELTKEIFQIVQQGGNISNISGTSKNNTSNNSVGGVTINDKTWIKKSAPESSESFEKKVNEWNKNKNKKYALIPNPKHQSNSTDFKDFKEFKPITNTKNTPGNKSNSNENEEVSDEIPNTVETINQWHVQEVNNNNWSKWDSNMFTGKPPPNVTGNKNTGGGTALKNHNQNFIPKEQFTQVQVKPYVNNQLKPNAIALNDNANNNNNNNNNITNYYYPLLNQNPNYMLRMGNAFSYHNKIIRPQNNNNNNNNNNNYNPNWPNPQSNTFGSISSNITATMSKTKNKKKLKDKFDQTWFTINLEQIILGKDTRTTVMIRHIPNKYNSVIWREEIEIACQGKYDFFYLPIDNENNCNWGYAFINFTNPLHILYFYFIFKARKWNLFQSNKECDLSFAKFQGKVEWTAHWGKYMNTIEDETKMPIVWAEGNMKKEVEIPKEYYQNLASLSPELLGCVKFI